MPIINVFIRAVLKYTPSALSTFSATIRNLPPGISEGGLLEISAFVLEETTNIQ
jgi:hypothetical protein